MTRRDERYFDWLVSQIQVPPHKTFWDLFAIMHQFEFAWTVPNDDNRVQDGKDLRYEFFHDSSHHGSLPPDTASFLEVLVGLSRRVAFTAGGDARNWAWRLIKNLGLNRCSDPLSEGKRQRVQDTLYACVWRQYRPDGHGGFFPLYEPEDDQTKLEIWHQMHYYVNATVDA